MDFGGGDEMNSGGRWNPISRGKRIQHAEISCEIEISEPGEIGNYDLDFSK